MPRNGSGVYSKPANSTAQPNTVIKSAMFNGVVDDLVADANAARPPSAGGTGGTSKQGGIDNMLDGITTVLDTNLRIADPVDRTKIARLDAGRITTGTVRVLNAPDRDINISGVNRGYLYGLTLSNNGADAVNDIDITAGEAADDSALPWCMVLAAAYTKRLDAAWSVGSGNGGLDTGAIANTTYHVWLIQRSDTGVVDVCFSASATTPTFGGPIPLAYDRKRRIGSIIRFSNSILPFRQVNNRFQFPVARTVRSSTGAASDIFLGVAAPTGIRVRPILSSQVGMNAGSAGQNLIGDGDATGAGFQYQAANASATDTVIVDAFYTNLNAEIRFSAATSVGTFVSNTLNSIGWWDDRGVSS